MKQTVVKHRGGEYRVILSKGILNKLPKYLKEIDYDKIAFIIDRNVFRLHDDKLSGFINRFGQESPFIVPPGEASKSYKTLEAVHQYLLKNKCTRRSLIIVIGGGVNGDLAGFAASTYMRGVKFLNIPTTLVAACDSAIGGKTGINLQYLKNIIGSFYQPNLVLIDPQFLSTLPDQEYRAGLGEIIKYGYLSGDDLFSDLRSRFDLLLKKDQSCLTDVLYECIKFKAAVTSRDETESGLRKILNLGHTFAHGFESASLLSIPHGLAVHGGIIASIYLSARLGLLNGTSVDDLLSLALKLTPYKHLKDTEPSSVYKYMLHDKKNIIERDIQPVLIQRPGCIITDISVPKNEVIASIKDLQKLI